METRDNRNEESTRDWAMRFMPTIVLNAEEEVRRLERERRRAAWRGVTIGSFFALVGVAIAAAHPGNMFNFYLGTAFVLFGVVTGLFEYKESGE